MLLYSLLYLTGYDLPLDELKGFRQLHSRTPGHPEVHHTAGVEMTTGPLGQGFAHAVGFAIAEEWLAAKFNRPGHDVINHHTYVICSDGDLMEGLSTEAASLAGHLKLGKIVVLYDDNSISLDGPTSLSFSEDVPAKFTALGWHVQSVDGMVIDAVDRAIEEAKLVTDRPSIICCKTIIGFGSPHKAGTNKSHGSPLGAEEIKLTKQALGIPLEPDFYVAPDALDHWRQALATGADREKAWNAALEAYGAEYPSEKRELLRLIAGEFGDDWLNALPSFGPEASQATREASRAVIKAMAAKHPALIGGSADLSESTYTTQSESGEFSAEDRAERNLFFGVREHAMVAAVNGITLHGGLQAYGGTFFNFSDYCKPSIRLAAIMHCPSIVVFTHDSIGVGEDGPTHQPIEQLTGLRATPNVNVFRPADGNETSVGWKIALESKTSPTLLVLSRQKMPTHSPATILDHPAEKGGYILKEASATPKVILIGTGSEVQHCVSAQATLESEGIPTRVVSMPSSFLFDQQSIDYQDAVLADALTVAVEAGATLGWFKYAHDAIGIDRYGLSAPQDQVMKELGITPEAVVERVKELLEA